MSQLTMQFGIAIAILAMALGVAEAQLRLSPSGGQDFVECEGVYDKHLQGIATNQTDTIYWCFTTKLVKTDTAGRVVKAVDVAFHHGDLCYLTGKLYVAVNLGPFNELKGADSWVYEYDGATLSKTAERRVPEVVFGTGGVEYHDNRFWVVGGLHPSESVNYVYEYSPWFQYLRTHKLPTGYTDRGIQTAAFANGHWWFGTYQTSPPNSNNGNRQLYEFNEGLTRFHQFKIDASLGIVALSDGKMLVGQNRRVHGKGYVGRVELAVPDDEKGLRIIPISEKPVYKQH